MARGRVTVWLGSGVLLAGVAMALVSKSVWAVQKPDADKSDAKKVQLQLAVVNYQTLIQAHPDYPQLQQLDEQLRLLKQQREMISMQQREAAQRKGAEEMETEVHKARRRLMAEKRRVQGDINALEQQLHAQMDVAVKNLQKTYEGKVRKALSKLKSQQGPELTKTGQEQIREYMSNLALLRERDLAAHRLEMEKQMSGQLQAERQRIDDQVAAYQEQLGKQYQVQRLNLQLKIQNASTDQGRKKAEDALRAITTKISQEKAAKATKLDQGFKKFRQTKQAALRSNLRAYRKKLDAEVASKLEAKQQAMVASGQAKSSPSQQVKAAMDKVRSELKADLDAKRAALQARLEAAGAQARKDLEAKRAQVQAQLRKVQARISQRIEAQAKHVTGKTKAELAAIDKQIAQVKKQRKSLYQSMVAQLNAKVKQVGQKKKIKMVIGSYVLNRSYDDLTDQAMVAVKQMGK